MHTPAKAIKDAIALATASRAVTESMDDEGSKAWTELIQSMETGALLRANIVLARWVGIGYSPERLSEIAVDVAPMDDRAMARI
jgi:hypothetical protein